MIPFSLIINRIFGGFFRILVVYSGLFVASIFYDYFVGSGCRSSVETIEFQKYIQNARMLKMFLFWLPLGVLFCPLLLSHEAYVGVFSRVVQLISDLAISIFCTIFLVVFYHIWLLVILPAEGRPLLSLPLLPECLPGLSGVRPTDFFNTTTSELQGILEDFQGSPIMRKMFPPAIIGLHSILLISQIPWKKESNYIWYNRGMLAIFGGGLYYFLWSQ